MPEDINRQLALSADLVARRTAMGDKADVPRRVDHLAFFKKGSVDAAVRDLEVAGFAVADVRRKLFKVSVEFHRTDPCDRESAAAFTSQVIAIVNKHDGRYDGWAAFLGE